MPQTLTSTIPPYEAVPNRIRWTRQQCDAMRDSGILEGRYELVDGDILVKKGQTPSHAYTVHLASCLLVTLWSREYIFTQSTLDLSDVSPDYDEPEPDMMVTLHPFTHYAASHPTPSDVRLLIEVSDSTLRMDRGKKANVYARAGIADYWIVDLNHRCVIVHRQPTGEGYQEVVAYNESEEVALLACPEVPIAVSQLLPPAN